MAQSYFSTTTELSRVEPSQGKKKLPTAGVKIL